MAPALRVSDAALWCGGKYFGPDAGLCRVWRHDSREVCPGDAFAALKGESSDGHLYLRKAVERGASLLLIDEEHATGEALRDFFGVSVLVVKDTTQALAQIASENLKTLAPTVIGITGSVGKTTTRELTASVLKLKYKVHSAVRSFNTVIGCSLTVLAMPPETEILMLEYGTSHFGEIGELVGYFPPDFAVITEIAPAHLEGFGDISGVLRAKMEICASRKLKCLVYNADNAILAEAIARDVGCFERVGVGYSGADARILDVAVRIGEEGAVTNVSYELSCGKITAEADVFGVQHAYNIGYALSAGKYFGVAPELAVAALQGFKPMSGRGVIKKINDKAWVVDESYNASPKSMEAAISNIMKVSAAQGYDLYAVLGGMREMGESSAAWHRKISGGLEGFKKVFLYGCEWSAEGAKLPENAVYCENMEAVMERVLSLKMENALMLIKGSNSYGLKKIVALLTEGANVY